MLNAVQNAAVGTEITVTSESDNGFWNQNEVYRVTGTTYDKILVPVNEDARRYWDYPETREGTKSISLTDRDVLRDLLTPSYDRGRVSVQRKLLTSEESREIKAEQKRERQRRAAERRQYKINFD